VLYFYVYEDVGDDDYDYDYDYDLYVPAAIIIISIFYQK